MLNTRLSQLPNNTAEKFTPEQLAYSNFLSYVGMQYPKYNAEPMHELIASALEAVEAGLIRRLLISAPPQHGKCCEENTLIYKVDGTSETAKDIPIGTYVFGYNDGHLTHQHILAKETTQKPSIQLTTKTGRTIIVSTDHRMLTFDGYKKATDITPKDFLLSINKEIEFKKPINEDTLRFATYMLFEGCCETDKTPNRSFSNADAVVIADFKRVCSSLSIKVTKSAGVSNYDYYVGYTSREILEKYGLRGHRSTEKRLPKQFFSLPLKQRWLFIDLMFQTDGYFAQSAGQGGITLANKELIDDIQILLSSCGIATTKFYKPNDCSNAWVLTVGRSQLTKIYNKCNLGSKRSQCASIIRKEGHSKITAFPNMIGRRLRNTRKNGFRCDNYKNITHERMERMAKIYPELKWYLDMDFIYDQIIKVETVGKRNLVHLQTSGTHTYIANGLVSHNTMLTSEFFPAWCLGRNPDWKVICATYNQERANEVGAVVRDQFKGATHKAIFPDCTVSPDIKSAKHVATEQRGHYYSIGLSSTGTGRGANIFLVDDPFKGREDAESKISREKVKEWYKAVLYTRLRPDNRVIIINTRWHLDDLTGYVLHEHSQEDWTIIELRAIAEEEDILDRKAGEALCPNMYSLLALQNIKEIQGTYNWESLYQQRPVAKEGGMVKYEWIQHYTEPPKEEEILKTVISWDTAYKADELSDPTAATVWQMTKTRFYLVDVLNKKMEFPTLIRKVKELHKIHHPSVHLIEGRASGQSLIQELKMNTALPVVEISTKNLDKSIRLDAVTGLFEAGKVWFPEKVHWRSEAEDQLCLFPSTKYDDIADSISQFLNWTNRPRYVRRPNSKLYWK
jgi:predicted phage terminase large subunit-like protein